MSAGFNLNTLKETDFFEIDYFKKKIACFCLGNSNDSRLAETRREREAAKGIGLAEKDKKKSNFCDEIQFNHKNRKRARKV